jgi:hypothetical protein
VPRGSRSRAAVPSDIETALDQAEPRPDLADTSERGRASKKNYAERLSRAIATLVANGLRPKFAGITPGPHGEGQESRARTAKGVKKLDVNYSTAELGLGLGVSIKTINFKDPRTGRYTKNYTRADNELRAEAQDYHRYGTIPDDDSSRSPLAVQTVRAQQVRRAAPHPIVVTSTNMLSKG